MTKKILIANRGEIACRIIRTVQEMGHHAVAVYSEADKTARHVRMADEAHEIGPARPAESYLNAKRILDVATSVQAAAVHPGYGFLSENTGFSQACAQAGIAFVGPSAKTIRLMGDKNEARAVARKAGVPVLEGSPKLDPADPEAIIAAGERTGFPVLVKAAGGGGGIGLRPVETADKLVAAVQATSAQAERAFSDPSVYLEKLVRRARHIEVQVFGFGSAGAVHLWHCECSAQRRYQKILEEARPRRLDPKAAQGMLDSAVALAQATNYVGAGTIEYLYDDETSGYYFMEMNTRLQVEHPVTEMITGLDLVELQIRQALGEDMSKELTQDVIGDDGHAIEVRICAERPDKQFIPSPGKIEGLRLPDMPGIRIDTGCEVGDTITPFYDSLVMKIIAKGSDRDEAIDRLAAALDATEFEGLRTNVEFLRHLVRHPEFRADRLHTKFVEENIESLI